jgi:hypothetical protein
MGTSKSHTVVQRNLATANCLASRTDINVDGLTSGVRRKLISERRDK